MVDFGSWQGYSLFETAGIARYFEDFKKARNAARGQKMPFMDGHYLVLITLNIFFFLLPKVFQTH